MVQRKKSFGIETPLELIDENSESVAELVAANSIIISQIINNTEELEAMSVKTASVQVESITHSESMGALKDIVDRNSNSVDKLKNDLEKTSETLKTAVDGAETAFQGIENHLNSFDPLTQNIDFGFLGDQESRSESGTTIPFVNFNGIVTTRKDEYNTMPTGTGINLTMTLGGATQYYINGGTRNFLGYLDQDGIAQNINFDLTKSMSITATIEGQTLFPGTIFTLYFVSNNRDPSTMYTANGTQYLNSSIVDELTASPQYNDSWGVGYRDAQGLGTGSSIELDLFEMTCNNIATTTHGINNNNVDDPTYDTSGSWENAWGGYGYIDPTNPSTDLEFTSTSKDNLSSPNPPLGPGPAFKINTTLPIDIKCAINAPTIKSTDGAQPGQEGQLSLITTLTQGEECITLNPQYIDGFFIDDPNLSNMQLVCSLWTTGFSNPDKKKSPANCSWWLDGFQQGYDSNGDINLDDYSVRSFTGYSLPQDEYLNKLTDPSVVTTLKSEASQYYDSYSLPLSEALGESDIDKVGELGPVMGRITNLGITVPSLPEGIDASTQLCWLLDGMYRGVQDNPANWTGAYGNAYGISTNGEGNTGEYGPGTGGIYYVNDSSYIGPQMYQSNVMSVIQEDKPGIYFAEVSGLGVTSENQQAAQDNYPNFTTVGIDGMTPYNYIPTNGTIIGASATRYMSELGQPFIVGFSTSKFISR